MSWKHEAPFEEEVDSDASPTQNAQPVVNHELAQPIRTNTFEPPSPDELSHPQEPSVVNGSQEQCERVVPTRRRLSPKHPSKTSPSLLPAHSTKEFKLARKKLPGPSRSRSIFETAPFDDQRLASGVDIELQSFTDHPTHRRSKRIASLRVPHVKSNISASKDPSEHLTRPKLRQKTKDNAARNSGNPQGLLQRQKKTARRNVLNAS
jgi:hypothetical protein